MIETAPGPTLTVTGPWQSTADYSTQYAETSDPRVLAVIQRDDDASAPYGDALCPAYWLRAHGYSWTADRAGETFADDDAAEAYARARDAFDDDTAARFMRIFHDTRVLLIDRRGNNGSDLLVLLDTPAYRTHVGRDQDDNGKSIHLTWSDDELFTGEREEWTAYLDGDVYGIGWATLPGRVTTEKPVDFDDFAVSIEVWSYYGEVWAKVAAGDFEAGTPHLPVMLDIPA